MAGPAVLLEALEHQAGALHTLRLVWGGREAATASHLPLSPPQTSLAQTRSAGRPGPARYSSGGEMEVARFGQAWELEEERKALGKTPEEDEKSGDLSPLSPSEPRPYMLSQPGLLRNETLREKALRSKLSRVVDATSRLIEVEQTLLLPLIQQHPFPLHPKDSIEFRNICSHMALQREGQQFEKDLQEAHQCLKTIIEKLLWSLAVFPSEHCIPVRSALRQILQNLLAM
ncbi:leukemia-associated protein 7 [Oxyura jamaicensis]|uniref:leukemia-associated protein 7 n=1 Tax=Oxyura jamaicensis TaxID=8884 RepID=UPI0015A72141|nr:leukemia-associated protein 7 [Oxyura jamaicensis]